MPAQRLTEKKMSGFITSSMNNTPSSQALMRQDDSYKQFQSTPHGSGLATPVFVTPSSAHLRKNGMSVAGNMGPNHTSSRQWMAITILTFINLINYMDRYTIAGLIRDVQTYYNINDSSAGALQTVFVSSYMVVAPIFGYLGDRYSRKWLLVIGISIWVGAVLAGSFMESFTGFIIMRAIVGIGEASYSTIAPTIISDMFVKDARSKCLAIFYFAIPVGSGLGYVVGKKLADIFGGWQSSMRGTPVLGIVAVVLVLFFLDDPPRGGAEGQDNLEATSYRQDVKSLANNGSFVLSTLGLTCVTFCTGALAWWGPKFLQSALYMIEAPKEELPIGVESVALIFGVIAMVAGILGVPSGALLSTKLKQKYPRADPVICGTGLFLSSIFFSFALYVFTDSVFIMALLLIFMGQVTLNLNWSIVSDILLYVVTPTRRGTAEAIQILISHLFGDAGSPYLVGLLSDSLRNVTVTPETSCSQLVDKDFLIDIAGVNKTRCDAAIEFYSMQHALGINIAVVALGAIFFFICAVFIVKDKLRVDNYLAAKEKPSSGERGMLMNPKSAEDPELTDEDEPPTLVAQPGESGILKKKLNRLSQERNFGAEKMYSEIKNSATGDMVITAFSRLVDSDSSLNTSSSSGTGSDKKLSDAEIVKELIQNRTPEAKVRIALKPEIS